MNNFQVHSFWIGDTLNPTAIISLRSFLAHGHEPHLWSYDPISNVPAEVVLRNADEILPRAVYEKWFPGGDGSDQRANRIPTFANYFRYKLIHVVGGWWVDLDTICLKPFDFAEPYVFCGHYFDSYRVQRREKLRIINGTFKAPAGCALLGDIVDELREEVVNARDPGWGVWGPSYFTSKIKLHDLLAFRQKKHVFAPFPPGEKGIEFQYRRKNVAIPAWAYALHFFNRSTMDLTGAPGSLFDIFSLKYLPAPGFSKS